MVPPSTATARQAAPARPGRQTGRGAPSRSLRVVPTGRRQPRRRRFLTYVPVAMVVATLLFVVAGQAMLANGQVRMSGIEQELSAAQGVHRQQELQVSKLETPARIVGAAEGRGMVHPSHVVQLPYVSLTTPLPAPNVTPAPAAPATSSAQTPSQ